MSDRKPPSSNQSAAQTFAGALKRHGVEIVFGQSIPSALFLATPDFGIRQVTYRTENAGAVMADAYARISHRVGVVTAQNGPAATLLVPGLAESLTASVPVVALVQDVDRRATDRNAFQELNQPDLFKGVSKWLRRVGTSDRIDDYVDMAFTAATTGRPGPAVLLVPYDLINETSVAASARAERLGHYPIDRSLADPARIERAADLLARAERPLIYAGGGVHSSGAHDALAALQEAAHIPVATTTMGKGTVAETHPLSLGVIGYFMGPRGVARYQRPLIDEADVILLVGNRTNQNGTDSWKLLPRNAQIIHLDIDGQEVGRNYEALRLVGDAKLTLEALTEALRRRDLGKRKSTRAALEARIADGRRRHEAEARPMTGSDASPLRPERVMAELDRILTPDYIVVADASYSSIWTSNFLKVRKPGQRFLSPRGMAGLGWGLPMAIGAKLARPEAPVFCLAGDGGFGHVWSELETARRNRLPLVLAVLNNQILGYQKDAEDVIFGDHTSAVLFEPVDHAMIARACGCRGIRIERAEDIAPALKEGFASNEVTLLDIVTDPAARPPITSFEGHFE
jgi:acetolactate synthase-1/2/3 large subunit